MHTKGSLFKWAFFYDCKYNMKFKLYTLVDITETGARRGDEPKSVRQQQNYLTVLQTIGLRVNPTYVGAPSTITEIPSKIGLGSKYKSKQTIWEYKFDVEYEDALDVQTLVDDFNLIPFIAGLDETVEFKDETFLTQNKTLKNIIFIEDDK